MSKISYAFIVFALFCTLGGCRLGPRYEPPCVDSPDGWKNPAPQNDVPDLEYWWEIFDDETLNELEQQATCNSHTLLAAVNRVLEARALAGVVKADLYPQISLNPSYLNTGMLFKIFLPNAFPIPNVAQIPTVYRIHQFQYMLPLTLNYELDFWGKNLSRYESACLHAQSIEAAMHTALLTLTTDLAASYFQLRALDNQIDLLAKTLMVRQKYLSVIESRYTNGLALSLDVSQAKLLFSNVEAQLYEAQRLRALQENMIAVLIGTPASCFCLPPNPLDCPPPAIPAGIPSEVLLQRPDIAQAEREMAAQHALIGAAYASFFPSFNLIGTIGYSSPDLKQFLHWKSRYWQIGANSQLPVYDGNRNCANLEATYAHFFEASENYQQQVLIVFREVEDALNNLQWQTLQVESYSNSVSAAQDSTKSVASRYQRGLSNSLDLSNAENAELQAEQSLAQLLGYQYLSTIQLIKALGGGFGARICD